MSAAEAVPSVLPEEGLDLNAELYRYQHWLIEQALIRTNGNRAAAARLLGIERTTLVMMLSTNSRARARLAAVEADEEPAEATPAEPETPQSLTGLAARIDWTWVAEQRAAAVPEFQISRRLATTFGVSRWAVDKVLQQPRPLAKARTRPRP